MVRDNAEEESGVREEYHRSPFVIRRVVLQCILCGVVWGLYLKMVGIGSAGGRTEIHGMNHRVPPIRRFELA